MARLAEPHERRSGIEVAHLAEAPQPVNLGGLERREHLLAARADKREWRFGHRLFPDVLSARLAVWTETASAALRVIAAWTIKRRPDSQWRSQLTVYTITTTGINVMK